MNPDVPIPPGDARRAATHRERVEAIEELRERIQAREAREPELRKEIVEFEKTQRTTIAELEKARRETIAELENAQRTNIAGLEQTRSITIAELEKTQHTAIAELEKTLSTEPENAEELAEELTRTRTRLAEELERTRTELAEKLAGTRTQLAEELAGTRAELDEGLARTRTELAEELSRMRAELASIGPGVIEARCTLGMKMSDLVLDEDEGHEQAIEFLQPLLAELHNHYRRALREAERDVAEAEETLKALQAEHHDTADAALAVVEQQFQPLIDAESVNATIESANVRVARHRLALVDPEDKDALRACELELDAALVERDAARAKVSDLQDEKHATAHRYSHPNAEKSKRLGGKLAKRFGHHH